jgi:hypothetical protein
VTCVTYLPDIFIPWQENTGTFTINGRFIRMNQSFFRPLTFLLLLAALALSACGAPPEPASPDASTTSTPAPSEWQPQPGDEKLSRGLPEISAVEILTLESFPLQFMVRLEGSKATPCHQLRAVVSEPNPDRQIGIEVYTVVDPQTICIQVIEDFSVNLPLGSFAAGEYTVLVNGEDAGWIMVP